MTAHIQPLGHRVELVPIDSHCDEITIALYHQQSRDGANDFLVHTYSHLDGARERIDYVVRAMQVLGGMEPAPDGPHRLRFSCGDSHLAATRRIFLEACKKPTGTDLAAPEAVVHDKKADAPIRVTGEGGGVYRVSCDREDEVGERRASAVVGGLVKLAEMTESEDNRVRFACGQDHHAVIGLLLPRAINVRAAMRDEAAKAARGVLAAPSAQER